MALKLCLQLNSHMEICLKTHVWEALECCRWYQNWISQLEILCSENIMFITYKTDCSTSPLTSNGCWVADAAQIIKPFTWQEWEQKGCGGLQGNTTNILVWKGDLSSVAGHLSLMHGLISLRYGILFFFSPVLSAAVCDSFCALEITSWFKMRSGMWNLQSGFPLYCIFVLYCFL